MVAADEKRFNELVEASKTGDLKLIQQIIKLNPTLAKRTDPDGCAPVVWSVFFDHHECTRFLLPISKPVNEIKDIYDNTLFISVAAKGDIELAEEFRMSGAEIKKGSGRYQRNAMMAAARYDQTDMIDYLYENGVDINAQDSMGFTALMIALEQKSFAAVTKLLDLGADVTAENYHGETAYAIAKILGYIIRESGAPQDIIDRLKFERPEGHKKGINCRERPSNSKS